MFAKHPTLKPKLKAIFGVSQGQRSNLDRDQSRYDRSSKGSSDDRNLSRALVSLQRELDEERDGENVLQVFAAYISELPSKENAPLA